MQAVGFPVVHRAVVGKGLGSAVRAAGMEGREFRLRSFADFAVKLAGGGLVKAHLVFAAVDNADGVEHAQGAEASDVASELWLLERERYKTDGAQVINFIRLGDFERRDERTQVAQVAFDELDPWKIALDNLALGVVLAPD